MFVILASNSSQQVTIYGEAAGKPFKSQSAAGRVARILDKKYPNINFLVLPIVGINIERVG